MRKMTMILPASLALLSCGAEPQDTARNSLAGEWRDDRGGGLCVGQDGAAAFVLYGENGANCMAQGRIADQNGKPSFAPRGDQSCRIGLAINGETVQFEDGGQSCSYYCGGDTALAGRTVRRSEATSDPLKDIAGDPIC